jgi:uncharacterized RDD family membrane protein YckC
MTPEALDTADGWAVRDRASADSVRRYAGLASRLAALVIDVAILTITSLTISVLPTLAWREVIGRSPGWLGATCGVAAAVLPWLYFTVSWRWSGQTVGDLLIGIAVQRNDGRRVSVVQAGLRAAIGLALAPIWLAGLLGTLWDGHRRAWHDVVFRTVVHRVVR